MAIIIGSARYDENGKLVNGMAGDQTGVEVSTQNFYVHSKGWYVLRLLDPNHANNVAQKMKIACNNNNIGYDQNERLGVTKYGVESKVKTECDCSSLVRQCVKEGTGIDPGNFNTSTQVNTLIKTKLFYDPISYTSNTQLYKGDILVTKTKGHTVIIVDGEERKSNVKKVTETEPKYKLVKINCSELNVRQLPNTSATINGTLLKNECVYVADNGNGWGKLRCGYGYISISNKYVVNI